MRSDGYHEAKVAFVSDLEGGSVSHINLVCSTALSTYALWFIAHDRWLRKADPNSLKVPLTEYGILILPLLLALTMFSSRPILLNAILCSAALLSARQPRPPSSPPLSPSLEKKPRTPPTGRDVANALFAQPFITSYRAIMMVMTVLCILAVDFPAFPREFAKAETWGTSLMDLGVGSFVFSLGLVSALPLLRKSLSLPSPISASPPVSTATRTTDATSSPSYLRTILTSLRKSLPVIALGLVRVIMVKGVEYPEHVTEYGVHWNFFFTLALLPVLGAGIERYFFARATAIELDPAADEGPRATRLDMHAVGLGVGVAHQILLSLTTLQRWALTAERTSLLSQNKEGLVSLPGYLSIYLLGLATGLYTLPPSPTFFRIMTTRLPASAPAELIRQLDSKREKALGRPSPRSSEGKGREGRGGGGGGGGNKGARKKAEWLASAAAGWWILYGLATLVCGARVSRRLANLTYVVWVAAFNTTFLCLYLILHLALASTSGSTDRVHERRGRGGGGGEAPAIFEAINRNGLLVFLAANLLTGLVNVSLETMYASDSVAVLVLTGYAGVVVGCAWALRTKKVKLS
ncbi:hypothetical protein JCM10908_003156 [Rhodotorula pacifica]|uniref:glucosaminyl-phosphotidylinositol O-acyltransferase n=1 Tax=Rhodotorula pacifica TaxID=1495444 RepID=UPI00317FA690